MRGEKVFHHTFSFSFSFFVLVKENIFLLRLCVVAQFVIIFQEIFFAIYSIKSCVHGSITSRFQISDSIKCVMIGRVSGN